MTSTGFAFYGRYIWITARCRTSVFLKSSCGIVTCRSWRHDDQWNRHRKAAPVMSTNHQNTDGPGRRCYSCLLALFSFLQFYLICRRQRVIQLQVCHCWGRTFKSFVSWHLGNGGKEGTNLSSFFSVMQIRGIKRSLLRGDAFLYFTSRGNSKCMIRSYVRQWMMSSGMSVSFIVYNIKSHH